MTRDTLGDRMKQNYELPARRYLTRRMPVVVRVDGKAFHTYTRGMEKPFSSELIEAMANAALRTSGHMQGFKAAYIQSDEASFLLADYDTLQTSPWFGYCQNKLESVTASLFTAEFNDYIDMARQAHFDARAFNVPREEVANYFLWRAGDWERNSVAMYAGHYFSHKQLHGQSRADQHEMLHSIGKNWATDLSETCRNGTWIVGNTVRFDIRPSYPEIAEALDESIHCDRETADA